MNSVLTGIDVIAALEQLAVYDDFRGRLRKLRRLNAKRLLEKPQIASTLIQAIRQLDQTGALRKGRIRSRSRWFDPSIDAARSTSEEELRKLLPEHDIYSPYFEIPDGKESQFRLRGLFSAPSFQQDCQFLAKTDCQPESLMLEAGEGSQSQTLRLIEMTREAPADYKIVSQFTKPDLGSPPGSPLLDAVVDSAELTESTDAEPETLEELVQSVVSYLGSRACRVPSDTVVETTETETIVGAMSGRRAASLNPLKCVALEPDPLAEVEPAQVEIEVQAEIEPAQVEIEVQAEVEPAQAEVETPCEIVTPTVERLPIDTGLAAMWGLEPISEDRPIAEPPAEEVHVARQIMPVQRAKRAVAASCPIPESEFFVQSAQFAEFYDGVPGYGFNQVIDCRPTTSQELIAELNAFHLSPDRRAHHLDRTAPVYELDSELRVLLEHAPLMNFNLTRQFQAPERAADRKNKLTVCLEPIEFQASQMVSKIEHVLCGRDPFGAIESIHNVKR